MGDITNRKQKHQKQGEFWESIIDNYEDQHALLARESKKLRERVGQFEATMPVIMGGMGLNIDELIPRQISDPKTCKQPAKLPKMEAVSMFSIDSIDLEYLDKIKLMAEKEKKLRDEVEKLKDKEHAFEKAIDEMYSQPPESKAPSNNSELQKANDRLIDENRRLADAVEDLKLSLKQNQETVQGPMARELERERRKAMQLEDQLRKIAGAEGSKQDEADKQKEFLKSQIVAAKNNLHDMHDVNDGLKDEIDILNHRIDELQTDLINQKISEAHTISMLKAELDKLNAGRGNDKKPPPGDNRGPTAPKPAAEKKAADPEGDSLCRIARDLSKSLVDTKGEVSDDLKDTVEGIKSLCDTLCAAKKELGDEVEPSQLTKDTPIEKSKVSKVSIKEDEPSNDEDTQEPSITKSGSKAHSLDDVVDEDIQESADKEQLETDPTNESRSTSVTEEVYDCQKPSSQLTNATEQPDQNENQPDENQKANPKSIMKPTPENEEDACEKPCSKVSESTCKSLSSVKDNGECDTICSQTDPASNKSEAICTTPKVSEGQVSSTNSDQPLLDINVSMQGPAKSLVETRAEGVKNNETGESYIELLEVITELETDGNVNVAAEVIVVKKSNDGFNVTTTITRSGMLEVITEGPAGIIETTMTVTASGNIEVITEFTEVEAAPVYDAKDSTPSTQDKPPQNDPKTQQPPKCNDCNYMSNLETSKNNQDSPQTKESCGPNSTNENKPTESAPLYSAKDSTPSTQDEPPQNDHKNQQPPKFNDCNYLRNLETSKTNQDSLQTKESSGADSTNENKPTEATSKDLIATADNEPLAVESFITDNETQKSSKKSALKPENLSSESIIEATGKLNQKDHIARDVSQKSSKKSTLKPENLSIESIIEATGKSNQKDHIAQDVSQKSSKKSALKPENLSSESIIEATGKSNQRDQMTRDISQKSSKKSTLIAENLSSESIIEATGKSNQRDQMTRDISQKSSKKSTLIAENLSSESIIEATGKSNQRDQMTRDISQKSSKKSTLIAENLSSESIIEATGKSNQKDQITRDISQKSSKKSTLKPDNLSSESIIEATKKSNRKHHIARNVSQKSSKKSTLKPEILCSESIIEATEISNQKDHRDVSQNLSKKSTLKPENLSSESIIEATEKSNQKDHIARDVSQKSSKKSTLKPENLSSQSIIEATEKSNQKDHIPRDVSQKSSKRSTLKPENLSSESIIEASIKSSYKNQPSIATQGLSTISSKQPEKQEIEAAKSKSIIEATIKPSKIEPSVKSSKTTRIKNNSVDSIEAKNSKKSVKKVNNLQASDSGSIVEATTKLKKSSSLSIIDASVKSTKRCPSFSEAQHKTSMKSSGINLEKEIIEATAKLDSSISVEKVKSSQTVSEKENIESTQAVNGESSRAGKSDGQASNQKSDDKIVISTTSERKLDGMQISIKSTKSSKQQNEILIDTSSSKADGVRIFIKSSKSGDPVVVCDDTSDNEDDVSDDEEISTNKPVSKISTKITHDDSVNVASHITNSYVPNTRTAPNTNPSNKQPNKVNRKDGSISIDCICSTNGIDIDKPSQECVCSSEDDEQKASEASSKKIEKEPLEISASIDRSCICSSGDEECEVQEKNQRAVPKSKSEPSSRPTCFNKFNRNARDDEPSDENLSDVPETSIPKKIASTNKKDPSNKISSTKGPASPKCICCPCAPKTSKKDAQPVKKEALPNTKKVQPNSAQPAKSVGTVKSSIKYYKSVEIFSTKTTAKYNLPNSLNDEDLDDSDESFIQASTKEIKSEYLPSIKSLKDKYRKTSKQLEDSDSDSIVEANAKPDVRSSGVQNRSPSPRNKAIQSKKLEDSDSGSIIEASARPSSKSNNKNTTNMQSTRSRKLNDSESQQNNHSTISTNKSIKSRKSQVSDSASIIESSIVPIKRDTYVKKSNTSTMKSAKSTKSGQLKDSESSIIEATITRNNKAISAYRNPKTLSKNNIKKEASLDQPPVTMKSIVCSGKSNKLNTLENSRSIIEASVKTGQKDQYGKKPQKIDKVDKSNSIIEASVKPRNKNISATGVSRTSSKRNKKEKLKRGSQDSDSGSIIEATEHAYTKPVCHCQSLSSISLVSENIPAKSPAKPPGKPPAKPPTKPPSKETNDEYVQTSREQSIKTVDAEQLRQEVEEALVKTNQSVMEAMEDANQNVQDALDKAQKDMQDTLSAISEKTKSSKEQDTKIIDETEKLPSSLEIDEDNTSLEYSDVAESKTENDDEPVIADIDKTPEKSVTIEDTSSKKTSEGSKLSSTEKAESKEGITSIKSKQSDTSKLPSTKEEEAASEKSKKSDISKLPSSKEDSKVEESIKSKKSDTSKVPSLAEEEPIKSQKSDTSKLPSSTEEEPIKSQKSDTSQLLSSKEESKGKIASVKSKKSDTSKLPSTKEENEESVESKKSDSSKLPSSTKEEPIKSQKSDTSQLLSSKQESKGKVASVKSKQSEASKLPLTKEEIDESVKSKKSDSSKLPSTKEEESKGKKETTNVIAKSQSEESYKSCKDIVGVTDVVREEMQEGTRIREDVKIQSIPSGKSNEKLTESLSLHTELTVPSQKSGQLTVEVKRPASKEGGSLAIKSQITESDSRALPSKGSEVEENVVNLASPSKSSQEPIASNKQDDPAIRKSVISAGRESKKVTVTEDTPVDVPKKMGSKESDIDRPSQIPVRSSSKSSTSSTKVAEEAPTKDTNKAILPEVSKIPVPAKHKTSPQTCDCANQCSCKVCDPEIMKNRKKEADVPETCSRNPDQIPPSVVCPEDHDCLLTSGEHPSNCECVDCITQPTTKPVVAPIDDIDCICNNCDCDDCTLLPQSLKTKRPPILADHPKCDCPICICVDCTDPNARTPNKMQEKQDKASRQPKSVKSPSVSVQKDPSPTLRSGVISPIAKEPNKIQPYEDKVSQKSPSVAIQEIPNEYDDSNNEKAPGIEIIEATVNATPQRPSKLSSDTSENLPIIKSPPTNQSKEQSKESSIVPSHRSKTASAPEISKTSFTPVHCSLPSEGSIKPNKQYSKQPVRDSPSKQDKICDCNLPCNTSCEGYDKLNDPDLAAKTPNEDKPNENYDSDVQELQTLMHQIKCACQEAEAMQNSGPMFQKQASDFKNTLSGLQIALDIFQGKCRTKDIMIDAMKEELKLRAHSKIFDEMLNKMAHNKENVDDYDRTVVCDALPRPMRPPLSCICETEQRNNATLCDCLVSSAPLEVMDVRRIGPNSIIVKWKGATSKSVNGYEVTVNDVLKSRILSSIRTSTILDSIEMKGSINITVYAISEKGRCKPPASAVYKM